MIVEDKRIMPAMNDQTKMPDNASNADFREVRGSTSVIAFFLGMALIASSILLGKSYAFFLFFLAFSIVMTLVWRNAPRPWIFLVSIAAATPVNIFKQQFPCNLIFAIWFAVLHIRHLFMLPKWIYLPVAFAVIGIATSVINWMSGDVVHSIMRQASFALSFVVGPFLLLPVIYLKMSKSRDHEANLQGLLFCLIIPSTLLLVLAKLLGSVANEWEASLHVAGLPEGYLAYQLGKVVVNFLRTEVGFILAALICASTAVAISQVKVLYRLVAGACLSTNMFLLLATASFGSSFACLCGLAAMFYMLFRTVNITKVIAGVAAMCCILLLIYGLSPTNTKKYLEKRYEHRVVKADTDRFALWALAAQHFLEHPEGTGWTLSVGKKAKSYIHNDYLTYAVSYGFLGGLAYTIIIVGLLISFFRVRKKSLEIPAALAVHLAGLGVIVALAVNGMTDHMNENRWYFNVIWSLIWYSYFCNRAVQTVTGSSMPKHKKNNLALGVR